MLQIYNNKCNIEQVTFKNSSNNIYFLISASRRISCADAAAALLNLLILFIRTGTVRMNVDFRR